MSRGISAMQSAVVKTIRERGFLSIFDVSDVIYNEKVTPTRVSEITRVQSLYRMMKSLEKRGLVATLLHERPKEWHCVKIWYEDSASQLHPIIDLTNGHIPLHIGRKGHAELRSIERTWVLNDPRGRREDSPFGFGEPFSPSKE